MSAKCNLGEVSYQNLMQLRCCLQLKMWTNEKKTRAATKADPRVREPLVKTCSPKPHSVLLSFVQTGQNVWCLLECVG